LLDQLIKSYVEFIKFKNKGFDSSNYRKELKKYKKSYEKYEEELEEKLGEEKMNEIQRILTECEEIANWQLELEEKINERDSIEEKKQFLQITISNNTGNVSIGHIQIGGSATIYQNKEQEFQPKPKPATQEKELNKDYRPAQKELNKEVNSLLRTKKDFVSFRQSTIESLQNCYNEFETSRGKYSKSTEVGNTISSVGGIVGTPVKLIGGGINSGTNFFRGKSHNKFNKDFQEHLLADEEMMTWLDKQYNSSSKYV